ncbi:glutamate ABC transporter substrate-binding protein [Streptomyces sp. MUM 178J]|uniref:glutamate ABC transporter substrate-binding protein n=1 Tax=Streptomyces sp. MUM 178J TaxID=2791991 RepID=UPI001F0433A3|nr:glutamate ABC transporter substrate-binding protein [Streptomyces sp. MUM 178J]WRQ78171.1 glutamate ABC transporter substrate-binding protein [Streptomyces sp. MUM 178J]
MKSCKSAATAAIAAITVVLAASGCSGSESADAKPSGSSAAGQDGPRLPAYKVAQDVEIDSPVLKRAQAAGKLVVGAKNDQPFLGYEDADGTRSGFDIEIAKMIAADLGFSPDQIEFRTIDSSNREAAITSGEVDLYVGTYTINDERKKRVGFAGPYYLAGADLLVRKDDRSISGPYSLVGKTVCSVKGSTALKEIKSPEYDTKTVETAKYTECVEKLLDEKVDAVTTDDAILMGYAAQRPGELRVVGTPFTEEPYGIGMDRDDKALREAVSDAIEAHDQNGDRKSAFDATLGRSGSSYGGTTLIERY